MKTKITVEHEIEFEGEFCSINCGGIDQVCANSSTADYMQICHYHNGITLREGYYNTQWVTYRCPECIEATKEVQK
jgi:hypothetical protein